MQRDTELVIFTMKKTYCPTCSQPTVAHRHSIARMLANILLSVRHFQTEFHLQKDTALTKNQYNNFQKLKYWGLVANNDVGAGYWYITLTGKKFIAGEIRIPKWVKTFNNRVVEESEETINIADIKKINNKTYKKREEYILDAECIDL